MKLTTPKYIIEECERLIEALPEEYKDGGRGILRRLNRQNTLEGAMKTIQHMYNLSEVVPNMTPRLFRWSHITEGMMHELWNYTEQKEVKKVLDFIYEERFGNNSTYQKQIFRVVKSQEEWESICSKTQTSIDIENVQIILETWYPDKSKLAYKAFYQLCNFFDGRWIKNCEVWFQTGQIARYNIYLP